MINGFLCIPIPSFSILDGASRIPELVDRAVELGMPALGISDHGNLFGVYSFWKECKAKGIKPILGMEAYVAPESRHHKKPVFWGTKEQRKDDVGGQGAYTHMLLIAQSDLGLRNLYKLHNLAYTEGFYRKPRIDLELLEMYGEDIIGTTGCAGGAVPTLVRLGLHDQVYRYLNRLYAAAWSDPFIEVMYHGTDFDEELNAQLLSVAKEDNLPLLATNDSHYTLESDAHTHDALLAVQTRSTLDDPNRFSFSGSGYHLRSYDEMVALPLPREALENTVAVANRVGDYDEVFKPRNLFPRWKGDVSDPIRSWAEQGLAERYPLEDAEAQKRLDYELDTIVELGFSDYFVVLAGLLDWAKRHGIMVGPGRGSAAGCITSYCLGITGIDPLRYGLLFERFINPERVSAPDIDVDLQDDRRNEVFAYAQSEYGRDYVAHPVTFGIIKARAALKDAARVLGRPYSVGNELSGLVPKPILGRDHPLKGLDDIRKRDPEVYDLARGLEGLVRNVSMHAAGLVISPEDLTEIIPIHTGAKPDEEGASKDNLLVTGFPISELEEMGMLKYDLLGLKTLTIISDVLELIGDETT